MKDGSGTPINFFDCNMRLGRAGIVRPEHILDADGLQAEMDYCGIDYALTYHAWSQEWDATGGNRKLLDAIKARERFFPCLVALPHATGEQAAPDDLAAEINAHHGAVRLYPRAHQYVLSDWCMGRTFKALAEARVPVLLEVGQVDWGELAHILKTYPRLPIILLGSSYRVNRYLYALWEEFDNLYLETATYQVMRGIEDVCRRFGPERLVFGTGLPLLDAGGPIAQIMYAEIRDDYKALIAGGTLAGLLDLTWPLEGCAP